MAAAGLTLRRRIRGPFRWTLGHLARLALSLNGVVILLAGAMALRLFPWFASYPLHRDEALYGYWARLIASGSDPLLLSQWVDKPPLVLYLEAISLHFFGASSLSLRLPGMIASGLLVLATWGLTSRLFDRRTAIVSALLVAASPFAILFSPTAFTDPWLVFFMIAAAWAAAARRSWMAGILCGLAIASKQQGLFAVPLVLALLWLTHWRGGGSGVEHVRWSGPLIATGLFVVGLALVMLPVYYWDQLRWASRPSFWDQGVAAYGGLGLTPLATWPKRADGWAVQVGLLWGAPLVSLVAVAGGAIGALLPDRGDDAGPSAGPSMRKRRSPPRSGAAADWVIVLYVAGYLLLHVLVSFQAWDRYLLPLVPLVSILVARAWFRVWPGRGPVRTRIVRASVLVVSLALLLAQARVGVAATIPVGSDHGAYAGLDRVVAVLKATPADAVIYHRWLGWHYDFYLFGTPQERRWWGTAWKLADDAAKTAREEPGREQWVALPAWEDEEEGALRLALAGHRLDLIEVMRTLRPDGTRSFTLFRIDAAVEESHA